MMDMTAIQNAAFAAHVSASDALKEELGRDDVSAIEVATVLATAYGEALALAVNTVSHSRSDLASGINSIAQDACNKMCQRIAMKATH